MGLEAIYPKPRLSLSSQGQKRYPYLLRDLIIDRPNQVWCADITYIRMLYGFIYLVAIMDWFSRCVLPWEISTTLDTTFCIRAWEKTFGISKPEVFNTDQEVLFTNAEFTEELQGCVGARSAWLAVGGHDNIFIQRHWRTVKYEEVYLHGYSMVSDARNGPTRYFLFNNRERLHTSLGYPTPYEVYFKQSIPLNQRQASQVMH